MLVGQLGGLVTIGVVTIGISVLTGVVVTIGASVFAGGAVVTAGFSVLFEYGKDKELQFNFMIDNSLMMPLDFLEINRKYYLSVYYDALNIQCISIYYDDEKNKKEIKIDVENILYLDKIIAFFSTNK